MKEVRAVVEKENKLGNPEKYEIKLSTRAQIEKTIVEGMAHVQKNYDGKCTIADLMKEKQKLEKRIRVGMEIPLVNFGVLVVQGFTKKKIELLDDILHMYQYANDCDLDFLAEFGDEKGLLDKPLELEQFLNEDFYKGFGHYLYTKSFSHWGDDKVEDYLRDEKLVLDALKEKEEKNGKNKGGR